MEEEIDVSVVKTGKGIKLKAGDKMRLHYACALSLDALLSGDYIDNSEWHAEPVVVTVGSAEPLPGLVGALDEACLGDTLRVKVPAELAFGARGVPGRVPGNAILFFHIEISTPPPASKSRSANW